MFGGFLKHEEIKNEDGTASSFGGGMRRRKIEFDNQKIPPLFFLR